TPAGERNPADVTWELFKKRSNGSFTTTNIKKKGDGSFTFGEVASKNSYRLEAYLHEPEGSGPTTIDITPQPAGIPKINKVELRYVDDSPGTVFSYTEKMVAVAHCVNLIGEKLLFTLWEDDAAGEGHNSKNKFVDSKQAVVGRTGTATAEFILTKALMQKAAQGERDPKELEFYVTVEYYKDKKHASDNVELKNPDYKPPVHQPTPAAPAKGNSPATAQKAPAKAPGSSAASKPASQKEESGILDAITESLRNKWNELWDWAESKGTVKPDKKATPAKPEGKTTSVVEGQEVKSLNCGEKYCIKKGDKNELVREINIRLAGFGGNVPTDEFTDRTEKMVKQFQRDYMKVPETGRVCGNVIRAIDEFSLNFDISKTVWNQLSCSCSTKGKQAVSKLKGIKEVNKCDGFGDKTGDNTEPEKSNKYEFPGVHRSLLFGFKAVLFYLSKQKTYSFGKISSGYRCRFKNFKTTNHQGKAIDIQFDKGKWQIRGQLHKNIAELTQIRQDIFYKYLNAKTSWTEKNNFSLEPIGLQSDNKIIDGNHTYSWIHLDVREFDKKYMDDKFFCKNSTSLNGKNLLQIALESGFVNTCNCMKKFESQQKLALSTAAIDCDSKFKKVAPIILKHEGGFVDHPADKGGATNKGITFATWQKYAKEDVNIEPTLDNLKAITDEQATTIYRKRYWEPKGFCKIEDERVGLMVYDWTITSGGAGKQVQKLLKDEFEQDIKDDGTIGSKTIEALNNVHDQDKLLTRIAEIRKQYYTNLTFTDGKKNNQDVFLKGWLNRVDDCLNFKP
ncbi:glycosyl hydrolase 108 family protein, partial [uncultured Chryseobacterium sp.]|uniref:glycosyl hydrolase 108 family protein n=1 Tax=uncultured Chryseobacterium sp. TaxID=259322 RepID=UPI0025DACCC9